MNTTDFRSEAEVDINDLKRRSVRGGALTTVSQGILVAIQLTSTVVLARLLTPDDYGVIAMVVAVTSFADVFRDLGLSAAAIQKKELTLAQQSNLFWLNVAMGLLLTVLVAVASPLVSWFYDKPELVWVTVSLSFGFTIGSVGSQHGAALVRNMQFGRRTTSTISGALVALIVSVSLAFNGFSYWSLVWGNLSGSLTTTFLFVILSPFRTGWISKGSGLRKLLEFGADVTAFDFVNYFHRNLDNVLIGKFIGPAALGIYSRAYALLMLPILQIRGPINQVAFPALSSLQDNPRRYAEYYLSSFRLIAGLSIPLTVFTAINAHDIVYLSLGEEWLQATKVFAILSLAALVQPVTGYAGTFMQSLGDSRRYLFLGIANCLVVSLGFLIGIRFGIEGVAISYVVTSYIGFVSVTWFAYVHAPFTRWRLTSELKFPVLCSGALALLGHLSNISGYFTTTLSRLLIGTLLLAFAASLSVGPKVLKGIFKNLSVKFA